MSPELDDKICQAYPKLFSQRNDDPTTTAMCWGLEVGNGWFTLIDNMCFLIQNHIDWMEKKNTPIPQVVVTQVKEKFGALRFYYDGGDEHIHGIVRLAESMSESMCENCGAVAKTEYNNGWLSTKCLNCRGEK